MATRGVRHVTGGPFWSGRGLAARQVLPEWVTVGAAAVILGLITARVASSGASTGGMLLLLGAIVPFALMLVHDLRRALLVVVVFDTAFQWDKNFFYDEPAANIGALGGLSLSVTTIALGGLYLLWFAEMATRRETMPAGVFRASLPLVVYITVTALSTGVAVDKALSGFEVALLLQSLLIFVYVAGTVKTRDDVRFLAIAIMVCLLAESVIALVLPLVGNRSIVGIRTYENAGLAAAGFDTRFGGTIGSPNTAASFFSLLIAPTIALVVAPVGHWAKRAAVVAVGLATIALILTLSRGGWIALAVSFIFLTLAGVRRGWISPRVPIGFAIVLTVVVLPFSGTLVGRLTGNDRGSAGSRVPLMHLAASVIRDHPVLGVGVNNLGITFPKYAGPQYGEDWIFTVHNKYLLVWAEAGIAALAAFLWFLVSTIRRGWRLWRSGDRLISPLALGITAGVIGQLVHMSVDIFQSRPQVQLLWLLAAFLVAMETVERTTERAPAPADPVPAGRSPVPVGALD
jgi:putative inorganic carbon (hco3(-)) transporter